MSYAIYKTEALVVRIIPQGESNIDVVFLTKELGKVIARVQSGRASESKMRMQLTRYHKVVIDLVRGKTMWRLTGVAETEPNHFIAYDARMVAYAKALRLAEILIHGEESHPELFVFFTELLFPDDPATSDAFEVYCVIKVLEFLGYWHGEILSNQADASTLAWCYENKKILVAQINESIQATQMVVY
jgi:recombinational DNA repair protein (RecF pathway)